MQPALLSDIARHC